MTNKEYQKKVIELLNGMSGEEVEHVQFGRGIIAKMSKELVLVKYDDSNEEKYFKKETFFKYNFPLSEETVVKLNEINCEYQLSHNKQITPMAENKNPKQGSVTFDDVIGLESVKEAINKLIIYPFKYQDIYRAFNKSSGGGILLYGAPGCGKTMIVKAIANEVDAHLYAIKCSDIKTKWYGESENRIKSIFEEARSHKKSIIFFDEFDALGVNRDGENSKHDKNLVAELLTQIDGFDSDKKDNTLLLIAATNKPWNIDSALLRSGRFTKKIFVGLPDYESIVKIIKKELEGVPSKDIDYEEIVKDVCNLSSADVVSLCDEAKDLAIKRSIANNEISPIITEDLLFARDMIRSTINMSELKKLKTFNM